MTYTMMQACRELGMTYQTLKFYCNQGLVPNVKRDKNNRRVFDERDVEWLRGDVLAGRTEYYSNLLPKDGE